MGELFLAGRTGDTGDFASYPSCLSCSLWLKNPSCLSCSLWLKNPSCPSCPLWLKTDNDCPHVSNLSTSPPLHGSTNLCTPARTFLMESGDGRVEVEMWRVEITMGSALIVLKR